MKLKVIQRYLFLLFDVILLIKPIEQIQIVLVKIRV